MIGNTIDAAVSCALLVSWSCARGKGDAAVGDAEHSDVRPVRRSCRGAEGEPSRLSAKGPRVAAYTQAEPDVVVELAVDTSFEQDPVAACCPGRAHQVRPRPAGPRFTP